MICDHSISSPSKISKNGSMNVSLQKAKISTRVESICCVKDGAKVVASEESIMYRKL